MIICKRCRIPWPDSAQYCGSCGGSFAGRRCPKGHLSPKGTLSCIQCGSPDLSELTQSYSRSCLARTLAWIACLVFISLLLPYIGWVFLGIDLTVGFCFGTRPSTVITAVFLLILSLSILLGVFVHIVPSSAKYLPGAFRLAVKTLKVVWNVSFWIARRIFSFIRKIVQGEDIEKNKSGRSPRKGTI